MLRRALCERGLEDGVDFHVSSAGTMAQLVGDGTMMAGSLQELAKRGLDGSRHVIRPLTEEELDAADLVITMEADHVKQVVLSQRECRAKTFTLKEIVDLCTQELSPMAPRGIDAIPWLAERRRPLPLMSTRLDVVDPIGGPPAMYARCADEIDELTTRLAGALWGPPLHSSREWQSSQSIQER